MPWNEAENRVALEAWKASGGVRTKNRPDGWPTRRSVEWWTPAEAAISAAMNAVEDAGASVYLTKAVTLLGDAREALADHVEGNGG